MKVYVFAPNIVIGITILVQSRWNHFCRMDNANFAGFFFFVVVVVVFCSIAIDRDRTTLLTTDNTSIPL